MASRGVLIDFAVTAHRSGKDPRVVAELLEKHSRRLYGTPPEKLPSLLTDLIKEVGL